MSFPACRSSGGQTSSALVHTGLCKLISVHLSNSHGSNATTLIVYDNNAASGTIVAKMILGAGLNLEYDMHGVRCDNGLYLSLSGGTALATVEFA